MAGLRLAGDWGNDVVLDSLEIKFCDALLLVWRSRMFEVCRMVSQITRGGCTERGEPDIECRRVPLPSCA